MSTGSLNQLPHSLPLLKFKEPTYRPNSNNSNNNNNNNHNHNSIHPGQGGSSNVPHTIRAITSQHNAQLTSARLFEIALQARVANADASRNETEHIDSNQANRKPTVTSNQNRSVHLTPQQWQMLTDYHEHDLFVRTRSWSFCLAIFGVGVALFGIGSPAWKWIGEKLHTSIICLLGCACLFGILGLGLAITGVCRSALILRLYYYHSAGECFLVSSICTACSLILFPFSAEACIHNLLNHNMIQPTTPYPETRFGYTYFLTWIAALFFLNSFICMNLDLIIQSFVGPLPIVTHLVHYCSTPCTRCRSKSSKRSPQSTKDLNRKSSSMHIKRQNTLAGSCKSSAPSAISAPVSLANPPVEQSTPDPKTQHRIPEILLSDYDQECEEPVESIDPEEDGDWI